MFRYARIEARPREFFSGQALNPEGAHGDNGTHTISKTAVHSSKEAGISMKLLNHTIDKVTLELTRHELHLANALI